MSTLATVTARCVHCAWRTDVERGPELEEVRSIHELIHPGGTVLVGEPEKSSPVERIRAIPNRPKEEPVANGNGEFWPREEIIAAIKAHALEHGVPPSSKDWVNAADGRPSTDVVRRRFGSWADAVEAAGFERPTRGGNRARQHARASSSAPSSEAKKREAVPPPGARTGADARAGQRGRERFPKRFRIHSGKRLARRPRPARHRPEREAAGHAR